MDSLYAATSLRIKNAEAQKNTEEYYMALRSYAFSFHDQHVFIAGNFSEMREKKIEGSYGFGIIKLDDGRYIAHYLSETGSAKQSGMVWGAEIVEWNGIDIESAVNSTSLIWAEQQSATKEGRHLDKCQYVLRAPIGTKSVVTFRNHGTNKTETVTLEAQDDDLEDLNGSSTSRVYSPTVKDVFLLNPIRYEILPGGIGYIRIQKFMPTLSHFRLHSTFKKALKKMIKKDVRAVIIDVRGNTGGVDKLVPEMCGHFFREKDFYEYVSYYNEETDSFEINPDETLYTTPREPYFGKPVIVLIDYNSKSTAEGLPMVVRRMDNGTVIGQYGTCGSFAVGMPHAYKLPEGITFGFLPGRSLDKTETIQIDADASGRGGIIPDIRIPITYETVYEQYHQHKDIILERAIRFIEEGN